MKKKETTKLTIIGINNHLQKAGTIIDNKGNTTIICNSHTEFKVTINL